MFISLLCITSSRETITGHPFSNGVYTDFCYYKPCCSNILYISLSLNLWESLPWATYILSHPHPNPRRRLARAILQIRKLDPQSSRDVLRVPQHISGGHRIQTQTFLLPKPTFFLLSFTILPGKPRYSCQPAGLRAGLES